MKQEDKILLFTKELNRINKITRYDPIDPLMKECVVFLNLLNIPTVASRGMYINKTILTYPYILGYASSRPKNIFLKDDNIQKKIAKKYHLLINGIEFNKKARKEYLKLVKKNNLKINPAYLKWLKENKKLRKRVENLLKEFYKTYMHSYSIPLVLLPQYARVSYIISSPFNKLKDYVGQSFYTKKDLPLILACQKEFLYFKDFLREKFFNL